ncbi:hypothetical protein DIPPA_05497 [Diplonema papillatum]|nr:hypothetical protein DIPPA_05497 [Diplonema papillatum]
MMDDDIEKRAPAKAGRRADAGKDEELGSRPQKGGWNTGPSSEQMEAQQREQEKKFEERYFGEEDEAPVNAMIPALETPTEQRDVEDADDLTRQVADAPKNFNAHHVQSLADLEKDGPRLPPSGEDIDIHILHEVLVSESKHDTEDVEWDPATLFQQLSSELQAEKEKEAARTAADSAATPAPDLGPGTIATLG